MKVQSITKRSYTKILKLSIENWKTYYKHVHTKPKQFYMKKGYKIIKLSKKNTTLLQNLFSNIKLHFTIQDFHFDNLKKHYAFNRLKFNPNQKTKRMQSMVTDYLMPKKNTQKILQPIFRELIEKAQNILNSQIIINKIMIERNKPENLNRLKEILQNSKYIKSQTKNVYLNAYGFHKDKLPKAFKKIMVYPFPAGMKNGTTILKGYDKKKKVVEFKKGARALLFDNTEIIHKSVLNNKVRYLIQIPFYQKAKKIKLKKENYKVEKITNSNFPLLTPSKVDDKIDNNNIFIKKLYSKIEKDLLRE